MGRGLGHHHSYRRIVNNYARERPARDRTPAGRSSRLVGDLQVEERRAQALAVGVEGQRAGGRPGAGYKTDEKKPAGLAVHSGWPAWAHISRLHWNQVCIMPGRVSGSPAEPRVPGCCTDHIFTLIVWLNLH